jgi:hypothetical protein
MYFFSDMQHVSSELNMEKTRLGKNMQGLIELILQQRGWTPDRLKDVAIYCVLPGARGASKANDRITLRKFWGALFGALGAQLQSFDTYLPS